jgi:hypothetical protein
MRGFKIMRSFLACFFSLLGLILLSVLINFFRPNKNIIENYATGMAFSFIFILPVFFFVSVFYEWLKRSFFPNYFQGKKGLVTEIFFYLLICLLGAMLYYIFDSSENIVSKLFEDIIGIFLLGALYFLFRYFFERPNLNRKGN